MRSRMLLPLLFVFCALAPNTGGNVLLGSSTASAKSAALKSSKSARHHRHRVRRYSRGPHYVLPIAPSYLAYDYPYYYSRGYYPRHIGPGYIYFGYPYRYSSYSRYRW